MLTKIIIIGGVVLAIVVVITFAIFEFVEIGQKEGVADEIIKDQSRIEQSIKGADRFDDQLSLCGDDGLRFDFATGKCVGN